MELSSAPAAGNIKRCPLWVLPEIMDFSYMPLLGSQLAFFKHGLPGSRSWPTLTVGTRHWKSRNSSRFSFCRCLRERRLHSWHPRRSGIGGDEAVPPCARTLVGVTCTQTHACRTRCWREMHSGSGGDEALDLSTPIFLQLNNSVIYCLCAPLKRRAGDGVSTQFPSTKLQRLIFDTLRDAHLKVESELCDAYFFHVVSSLQQHFARLVSLGGGEGRQFVILKSATPEFICDSQEDMVLKASSWTLNSSASSQKPLLEELTPIAKHFEVKVHQGSLDFPIRGVP